MSLEAFLFKLPKVELHVHLEGAIRPASLLSLASKNRVQLPAEDEAGLRRWFRFRDFGHFLEIFSTISRCLRDPEDFRILIDDFMAEQAIQNVLWSEVHFTVANHVGDGLDPDELRRTLAAAVRAGEERHGIGLRLIPDIVRGDSAEVADRILDWALKGKEDDLVVALGLTGDTQNPSDGYGEHFARAAREGLHRTAHAGEHGGPDTIRRTLEVCEPERLDHGVRAVEDEALLADLVARRMPLTVCPTSNVALGVVRDLASHPFDRLYRAGANVSVHTDDPQIFGTNLTREYLKLHRTFGYGPAELAGLALAGLRQAFLDDDRRGDLERDFRRRVADLSEQVLGERLDLP